MRITINGQLEEHHDGATVGDLLRHFELAAVRVAVEVNRELVPRARFDETPLRDGDTVEIVTFVGGG